MSDQTNKPKESGSGTKPVKQPTPVITIKRITDSKEEKSKTKIYG